MELLLTMAAFLSRSHFKQESPPLQPVERPTKPTNTMVNITVPTTIVRYPDNVALISQLVEYAILTKTASRGTTGTGTVYACLTKEWEEYAAMVYPRNSLAVIHN